MNIANKPQTNNTFSYTQFKGRTSRETTSKQGLGYLIHETAFFREPKTDNIATRELLNRSEKKDCINIVIAGCSTGEEALTQCMLLDRIKKKVNILGFDLSEKSINEAKKNRYPIQKPVKANGEYDPSYDMQGYDLYKDFYLGFDTPNLTNMQRKHKKLFNDYFEPVETSKENNSKLHKFVFWVKDNVYKKPERIEKKMFKLKEGKATNCKFIQGDVENIDKLVEGQKIDAIYFKNAMYHLTTGLDHDGIGPRFNREIIIRNICQKFKNVLNEGGLVIFGEYDAVEMQDSTTVPKIMKELGFKPLNKTKNKEANIWKLCSDKS